MTVANITQDQFEALLPIMVSRLVERIMAAEGIDENSAIEKLYRTDLYDLLADESSKVWQFSVVKLFDLYQVEVSGGPLGFPEY
jgi:hypothetical protein